MVEYGVLEVIIRGYTDPLPTHSQKVLVLTSTWKYMYWRKTMDLRKMVSLRVVSVPLQCLRVTSRCSEKTSYPCRSCFSLVRTLLAE
jgi:hypothetical protein